MNCLFTTAHNKGLNGAVAGDEDLIDFLIQKSRPYIYTTAIAPALCVATTKSLELIKQGEQNAKLLSNICYFQTLAKALNLPMANWVMRYWFL
jgi:8-amino-7-oxononanoate synthase